MSLHMVILKVHSQTTSKKQLTLNMTAVMTKQQVVKRQKYLPDWRELYQI